MAKVRVSSVHINPNFERQLKDSHRVDKHTKDQAQELVDRAQNNFNAMVKHTRPATTPAYGDSFYVEKTRDGWVAGNNDDAAIFVEFGAHPRGGPTRILGYRPFGKAIDEMGRS